MYIPCDYIYSTCAYEVTTCIHIACAYEVTTCVVTTLQAHVHFIFHHEQVFYLNRCITLDGTVESWEDIYECPKFMVVAHPLDLQ